MRFGETVELLQPPAAPLVEVPQARSIAGARPEATFDAGMHHQRVNMGPLVALMAEIPHDFGADRGWV